MSDVLWLLIPNDAPRLSSEPLEPEEELGAGETLTPAELGRYAALLVGAAIPWLVALAALVRHALS